jgi:hypothetical protein
MEPKDLANISIALKLIKITKSSELLDTTENFLDCLNYAPTKFLRQMLPFKDRMIYELHVARTRSVFLLSLLGKLFMNLINPQSFTISPSSDACNDLKQILIRFSAKLDQKSSSTD